MYARHLTNTPQTQPILGKNMAKNTAGGYAFAVDRWTRLDRFLVLGCEGGSYYATEQKLTLENAKAILECAIEDYARTIARIAEISESGRAPKNDPAIFALAVLASPTSFTGWDDDKLAAMKKMAFEAMPRVCRIGTHLFQFIEQVTTLRGWGRSLRTAVGNWYLDKDVDDLVFQITKYQQRNGWSHRDLLRLAHPCTTNRKMQEVLQYITQPEKWQKRKNQHELLERVEAAKTATPKQIVKLIREGLVREHIPTEHLTSPVVWEALLDKMPITAAVRNLATMTKIGLLAPLSDATNTVVEKLRNEELLRKGRVHPFNLLVALKTYSSGHGFRGSATWTPVPEVMSALEDAFYLSFGTIRPTGKRHLFGIDVSGSMSTEMNGTNVSCRSAAACLAMVGMRTEPRSYAFGFTSTFQDLGITKNDRLAAVETKVYHHNFGTTDCAVPMVYAAQRGLEVDAFVVLTDSETYAGRMHPTQALDAYRQKMGIDAKLIVVGMTSNGFTIADPSDARQLDIVGFDTSAPSVMADFVRGEEPVAPVKVGKRKSRKESDEFVAV